jgi:hypothetical protein
MVRRVAMKSFVIQNTAENFLDGIARASATDPTFVFVFADRDFFLNPSFVEALKKDLSNAVTIGCSTSGEIGGSRAAKETVVFAGARLEKSKVRVTSAAVSRLSASGNAGREIASSLLSPELKHVLVFAPGTNMDGGVLVEELRRKLDDGIGITGGLAGDRIDFRQTYTYLNGEVYMDRAVAIGFYGDSMHFGCGSDGGWRAFGPARRVTRAEGTVLYELDGKPALQLYREYLGDKAKDLPSSGLSYPFAIMNEKRDRTGIIRSALDIDHEKGALILAASVPCGALVCLMHADRNSLTEGAVLAARRALQMNGNPSPGGLVIPISCIARWLVMADDIEDETEALSEVFGSKMAMGGFYSYGEIAPALATGKAEFHNQTMTITYMTEM